MPAPLARYFRHHSALVGARHPHPHLRGYDDDVGYDLDDLLGARGGQGFARACAAMMRRGQGGGGRGRRGRGQLGADDLEDLLLDGLDIEDLVGDDEDDDDEDEDLLGDDGEGDELGEDEPEELGASLSHLQKKQAKIEARMARVRDRLEDARRKRKKKRLRKRLEKLAAKLKKIARKIAKKSEKLARKLGKPAAAAAIAAGTATAATMGLTQSQLEGVEARSVLAEQAGAFGERRRWRGSPPGGQETRLRFATAAGGSTQVINILGGTAAGTTFAWTLITPLVPYAVYGLEGIDCNIRETGAGAGMEALTVEVTGVTPAGSASLLASTLVAVHAGQVGQGAYSATRTVPGLRFRTKIERNNTVSLTGNVVVDVLTAQSVDVSIQAAAICMWLQDDNRPQFA